MDKQKRTLRNASYNIPPPYESHQLDEPISDCDNYGIYSLEGSNVIMNRRLEKFPAIINCSSCQLPVQTNVDKRVNNEGTIWAILCCCFGSPLLAFIVWFIDCFNEWTHHCPRCNKILGRYKPEATFQIICLLGILSLGVFIFLLMAGFVFCYYKEMQIRLEEELPTPMT